MNIYKYFMKAISMYLYYPNAKAQFTKMTQMFTSKSRKFPTEKKKLVNKCGTLNQKNKLNLHKTSSLVNKNSNTFYNPFRIQVNINCHN